MFGSGMAVELILFGNCGRSCREDGHSHQSRLGVCSGGFELRGQTHRSHKSGGNMRSLAVVSILALLAACVKSETSTPAADTSTAAMAPAPAPAAPAAAPISLKTVAGRYHVTSRGQSPDTSVVTYELNATGDTTGWTITYPNRHVVPVRVISVSGDSIVTETGPF